MENWSGEDENHPENIENCTTKKNMEHNGNHPASLGLGIERKLGEDNQEFAERLRRGVLRKSLFSAATEEEINTAGFSAMDMIIFKILKLSSLLDYKTKMEEEQKPELKLIFPETKTNKKFISCKEDNDIFEKYFEHREHCNDGASCNVRACLEITQLLTCWENCRKTNNFKCEVCGSRVQFDILMDEESQLLRRRRLAPLERLKKLIENYNGFKAIEYKNDWNKKSVFSATAEAHPDLKDRDFSAEEKKDMKLLKLLRTIHTRRCPTMYFLDCSFPDCKILREILRHVHICSNEESCTFKNCWEVKQLKGHWDDCLEKKNVSCSLCGDFLKEYNDLEKEYIEIENEINGELSNWKDKYKFYEESDKQAAENPSKFTKFFLNY